MNLSSMHHSFDIHLAQTYGMKEAIIIHHFQHWIRINKKLGRNEFEGRTWSYQTVKEIAAHFLYMTESEIYETIEKLCRGKGRRAKHQQFEPVLVKGNFNKSKYDQTTWYAFVDEEKFGILAQAKILDFGASQDRKKLQPTSILCTDTKPDTKTKREREGASTSRTSISKEPKIQRKIHVATTDFEHQKLIDQLGIEVTNQCYKKLSEWKEDTPQSKWKVSDYRSILRWVLESLKEEKVRQSKPSTKLHTPEENRKFSQHIAENFNPIRCRERGCRIDVFSNAVEIVPIGNSNVQVIQIKFSENGFKEQLENAMRKWGLY